MTTLSRILGWNISPVPRNCKYLAKHSLSQWFLLLKVEIRELDCGKMSAFEILICKWAFTTFAHNIVT